MLSIIKKFFGLGEPEYDYDFDPNESKESRDLKNQNDKKNSALNNDNNILKNNEINILLVEDDVVLSNMYKQKLKKSGFNVEQKFNGREAIEYISSNEKNINFILLDIMMPEFDGFKTLKKIREDLKNNEVKIYMFSNLDSPVNIERSTELGANGYLIKANTTPEDLKNEVEKIFKKEEENK